jgi:hypothetical protein
MALRSESAGRARVATTDASSVESSLDRSMRLNNSSLSFQSPWPCLAAAAFHFTAVLSLSPPAGAADPEDLVRKGVELRKAGRDTEALSQFQRAVEEKRTPRALAQLGLCEQAVGLWSAAERDLEEALKGEGDDDWKKKNAKALNESLAFVKGKLGSVDLWGTPAGASIILDDSVAGTLPLRAALRVAEGRRTFRVEAPGYVAETRTIEVRGGGSVREHVALTRVFRDDQQPAPAAVTRAVPRAVDAPADQTTTVLSAPPRRPDDDGSAAAAPYYERWWFWTAIAAGVVASGVATYLIVRRKDAGDCVPQAGAPCW